MANALSLGIWKAKGGESLDMTQVLGRPGVQGETQSLKTKPGGA